MGEAKLGCGGNPSYLRGVARAQVFSRGPPGLVKRSAIQLSYIERKSRFRGRTPKGRGGIFSRSEKECRKSSRAASGNGKKIPRRKNIRERDAAGIVAL